MWKQWVAASFVYRCRRTAGDRRVRHRDHRNIQRLQVRQRHTCTCTRLSTDRWIVDCFQYFPFDLPDVLRLIEVTAV